MGGLPVLPQESGEGSAGNTDTKYAVEVPGDELPEGVYGRRMI